MDLTPYVDNLRRDLDRLLVGVRKQCIGRTHIALDVEWIGFGDRRFIAGKEIFDKGH